MRRDFVFLVKGVSKDLFIYGDDVFFTQFSEGDSQKRFLEFLERRLGLKNWAGSSAISIFITRNDLPLIEDALENAFERVSGAADVYDALVEDGVGIASIFAVREGDAADAELFGFAKNHGRMRAHSKDGEAERRWQERTVKLRDRLFPAFAAAMQRVVPATELSEQLGLSLKMYRHGAAASAFGIEFLCKFSALEGLVCGANEQMKKAMLKERIGSLLPGPTDWKQKITDLWDFRCEASHQAKAFSNRFVQATKDVEFIFLAAVVFASENLNACKSVDDLWSKAKQFVLAPEVLAEPETLRGRVSRALMPLNEPWEGIGTTIATAFKDAVSDVWQPR